jgi:hypothetical protein
MSEMLETYKVIKSPSNVKDGDIVNGKVVKLAVDKEYRTALGTFLLLFKSTRFQAIAAYTIAGLIVNLVPDLASARPFINQVAFVLVAVFIAGKSLEDAATAWKGVEKEPPPISPDITDKLPEMAKIFWDLFNEKLLSQENGDQPVEPAPTNVGNVVGTPIPSASVYSGEFNPNSVN